MSNWRDKLRTTVEILGDTFTVRKIEMSDLGTIDGLDMQLAARLFVDTAKSNDRAEAEREDAQAEPGAKPTAGAEFVANLAKAKDMNGFFSQFASAVIIHPEVTDWPSDDTITPAEVAMLPTSELVKIFNAATGVGKTAPFRDEKSDTN